jgi:hypothetical protein
METAPMLRLPGGRLGLTALILTAALAAAPCQADEQDRLYDFTDAYYLANGVNPAGIAGRRQADGIRAVVDQPFFAFQRPVRALSTFPAYNHSGDLAFFTVMGGGSTSLFTNDAAGRRARVVADSFIEYVFPRADADKVAIGRDRQAVILDMRNGYFGNDPLGLWIHVWVSYTDRAFQTRDGQRELADLARRNGLDRDGTPLIRTVGDIDRLFGKGLVSKTTRGVDDPLRYAICPVVEDPTDGGIAPDQVLNVVRLPDGTPLEPEFVQNFESLRLTGRWAR